jgi:hypothetical protein
VTGGFGNSIMFVAHWKLLNEWYWIQPGGIVEKIAEPEKLFLDEDYVNKNLLKTPRGRREKPTHIHRKRADQLQFELCE